MKAVGQNQIYLALDTKEPFLYTCIARFQKDRYHCVVLFGGNRFAMRNEHDYIDLRKDMKEELLCFFLSKDYTTPLSYEDHDLLPYCNTFTTSPIERNHTLIENIAHLNQLLDLHFPRLLTHRRNMVLDVFHQFNRRSFTLPSAPTLSL